MEKFKRLLHEVKNLGFPEDKFAIFGSGPLAIRDIRDSGDIDLVVKPEFWQELIKKFPITDKYGGIIEIGEVEVFKDWKPWFEDANLLIDDADFFEGIRFVKLKYLLEWKKAFGRDKDKIDLPMIESLIEKENKIG